MNKKQINSSKEQHLAVWTDPEIATLKLKIKKLEKQFKTYYNEKAELEELLYEFLHRHTVEFEDIILEIIKLRKRLYKSNESTYEEEKDEIYGEEEKGIFDLTDEQIIELKKKFRKATMLCHPDKICDELEDKAQEIFIELKQAYDRNDLKRVTELLNEMKKSSSFKSKSENVLEKDILKAEIERLNRKIKILKSEIIAIESSDTFKIIENIRSWDYYFMRIRRRLLWKLEKLQDEIAYLE